MNTQDQINNLETLLAAVEAQPVALFDLSHYQQKSQCGTMFCTAGLATTLPHFQQQGFYMATTDGNALTADGSLIWSGFVGVKVGEGWIFDKGVAQEYFGASFDDLFAPAGCGSEDDNLGYSGEYTDDELYEANMTDKELAVARLTYVINTLKEQA